LRYAREKKKQLKVEH